MHCTNINSIFGLSPNIIGKNFGMKMKFKIKKARLLGPFFIKLIEGK